MNNSYSDIILQEEIALKYFNENKFIEAETTCNNILSIESQNIKALILLSAIKAAQEDYLKSWNYLQTALNYEPNNKTLLVNSAILLFQMKNYKESFLFFDKALKLFPEDALLHYNYAFALQEVGNYNDAIAEYERTVAIEENVNAKYNLSMLYLLKDDFAKGFALFEYRFQADELKRKSVNGKRWNGEIDKSKTLYIWQDQGLGDTIQFVRFVKKAKERIGKIILEVQKPLLDLFSNLAEIDKLVITKDNFQIDEEYDFQIPIMSLPYAMNISNEEDFEKTPYLPVEQQEFPNIFTSTTEVFRIGIAWRGSFAFKKNNLRSASLNYFLPILENENVKLFSFQKEITEEEKNILSINGIVDLSNELNSFLTTAQLLKKMDLVISTDTSFPHISGAIGIETWLVLAKQADWRWGLNREDSIWYEGTKLFRQEKLGDWNIPFENIYELLKVKSKKNNSTLSFISKKYK